MTTTPSPAGGTDPLRDPVLDPAADRLGRGWAFPPAPSGTGRLGYLDGASHVRQSIRVILATEPGERVMLPDFGCPLRGFVMAPNTPATRAAIGRAVQGALARWEPRIVVRDVEVSPGGDPAIAVVTVAYTHVRDASAAVVGVLVPVGAGVR